MSNFVRRWWRSPSGYYLLYSTTQRVLHHFNLHHTTEYYLDGDIVLRCQWCGLHWTKHRASWRWARDPIENRRASADCKAR